MKRNIITNVSGTIMAVVATVASVVLFSCNKEIYDGSYDGLSASLVTHHLSVSPQQLTFDGTINSTKNLTVESQNVAWAFTSVPDWIDIEPKSGTGSATVRVSIKENTSAMTARTGIMNFVSTTSDYYYSKPITISQSAATPRISVEETAISFDGVGGAKTVDVVSNCDWTVSVSSNVTWLEASNVNGSLVVSAEANSDLEARTGTVYLKYDSDVLATLEVTQHPANVAWGDNTTDQEISVGPTVTSVEVTLNSDIDWTTTTTPNTMVSPSSGGSGSHILKISFPENYNHLTDNQYAVYVYTGSTVRCCYYIKQSHQTITADKDDISLNADGDPVALTLSCNADWTVTSKPDWVTISQENGVGDATLLVSADENTSNISRSGQISINLANSDEAFGVSVAVDQRERFFNVDVENLYFDNKASTQQTTLLTDGKWTATTSEAWISTNPSSGQGDQVIDVSVEQNTGDKRSGMVSITMGSASATINVEQEGEYMKLETDGFSIGSRGGDLSLWAETNTEWSLSAKDNPGWIHLSQKSGEGNVDVIISIDDNPSINSRNATLLIATAGRTMELPIVQEGRYLSVSTSVINFLRSGGVSSTIIVSTDGEYSISTDADWLVLNTDGNVFTVTATENATNATRTGKVIVSLNDVQERFSVEIPVGQEGAFINVNPTSLKFNRDGGTQSVSVSSNCQFEVTGDSSYSYMLSFSVNGNVINVTVGKLSSPFTPSSWSTYLYVKSIGISPEISVPIEIIQNKTW